jgi:hypothetical protein
LATRCAILGDAGRLAEEIPLIPGHGSPACSLDRRRIDGRRNAGGHRLMGARLSWEHEADCSQLWLDGEPFALVRYSHGYGRDVYLVALGGYSAFGPSDDGQRARAQAQRAAAVAAEEWRNAGPVMADAARRLDVFSAGRFGGTPRHDPTTDH